MEIEGSLLPVGLCPGSAITQKPNENPIAFLERLKESLQKFTNLDLDSNKGQVILKDKFLPQPAWGFDLQEAAMPQLAWGSAP